MNINKIQTKPYVSQNANHNIAGKAHATQFTPSNQVSFQGNLSKHCWLKLKNLSKSMTEITEFSNAAIAAIGTGIIAPLIILCSPGKGDQEDKDKKFFQAIRQPLSAFLALGFQVPATYAVNSTINNLAYKTDSKLMQNKKFSNLMHKFFDDDVLGTLVPDKKFIKKNLSGEEISSVAQEFEAPNSTLKKQLEARIRENYEQVGLDISDDKLAKQVQKEKTKFIKETAVDRKYRKLLDAKCTEMRGKNLLIKETDLVTADLKEYIAFNNKAELAKMEKDAGLTFFDKAARLMGFETKKLSELKTKQDKWMTEKGIELLKEKDPQLFTDAEKQLKKFVDVKNAKAQKIFANKKFWLSLGINLFMVTASCYALNWAHPKLKAYLDARKEKKAEKNGTDQNNTTNKLDKTSFTSKIDTSSKLIEQKINEIKGLAPQNQKVEVK